MFGLNSAKLREAEVLLSQGKKVPEMVKAIGISEVTPTLTLPR